MLPEHHFSGKLEALSDMRNQIYLDAVSEMAQNQRTKVSNFGSAKPNCKISSA